MDTLRWTLSRKKKCEGSIRRIKTHKHTPPSVEVYVGHMRWNLYDKYGTLRRRERQQTPKKEIKEGAKKWQIKETRAGIKMSRKMLGKRWDQEGEGKDMEEGKRVGDKDARRRWEEGGIDTKSLEERLCRKREMRGGDEIWRELKGWSACWKMTQRQKLPEAKSKGNFNNLDTTMASILSGFLLWRHVFKTL